MIQVMIRQVLGFLIIIVALVQGYALEWWSGAVSVPMNVVGLFLVFTRCGAGRPETSARPGARSERLGSLGGDEVRYVGGQVSAGEAFSGSVMDAEVFRTRAIRASILGRP